MPLPLIQAESTDLFVGTPDAPRQVLRVRLPAAGVQRRVTVTGAGATGAGVTGAAVVPAGGDGEGRTTVEVGLDVDAEPGAVLPVTVTVSATGDDADPGGGSATALTLDTTVTVERTGYTLHMVSHFHYDPVWWNTQAAYTTPWEWSSGDASTRPLFANNSFALVDAHLDLALRDPDYRFVLAEIDYLKPYFDVHPHRREDLRRLMAQGRVELLGGTYNEPNTNLTGPETTIRNLVYGIGYQRDILGGDPRTAWQLDVFGHDPQFPGYAAAAGLTGSAWARGPFHQWGPILKNFGPPADDATVMQFPSEFEWIAPSGLGVLTHYMPNHYSAGWWMDSSATLEDAQAAVYELYRALKPVAATRHMLLPVGTDYTPPNKWVTAIHRSWNDRYVWPRFVCATPREFLDAVRAEFAGSGRRPSPQTRDMNPVYTGKDVSYIDTKQAQRAAEVAATDAEKLATIATVLGLGRYPHAALDKVWRHLAFGAHHDAITGSESDQVYIDLLGGWREAYDLAAGVRDAALDALFARVDVTGPGRAVVVANTLSFERSDLVRVPVTEAVRVLDDTGAPVPALCERGTVTFRARGVPAMGWRTWRLVDPAGRPETGAAAGPRDAGRPATGPWTEAEGHRIANERYRVAADPARGGALTSIVDTANGRELLRGLGNELRVYDEYPSHPQFGEGPWHLLPTGTVAGSSGSAATVRRLTGPIGERLVVTGTVDGIRYEQCVTLYGGADRIDFRTRVLDHAVRDTLVRVRFPVDLPGALPVAEVAAAVVGRGYALPDVDVAEAPWTLDTPANSWFGLGATGRVSLTSPDGVPLGDRAIGVAEVVVPGTGDGAQARDLVVALARAGVTATTSRADGARYGWLNIDSNLPDFRIVLGDAGSNAVTRELLARAERAHAGAGYADALARHGAVWIPADRPLAQVWQPNADLRDLGALPALVVTGPVEAIVADLADARIEAVALEPPAEPLTDATVALLTYGLPGFAVDPAGALHLSLLRSCTGWPSGVWIDPPRRTAPDGSPFQLQHWTHEFRYALVSGDGDWRALTLPARGQEYVTPLLPRLVEPRREAPPDPLPGTHSFIRVEPARRVLLNALKPAGNPIASGSAAEADPAARVTLRLAESTGLGAVSDVDGALALRDRRAADLLERDLGPARRELTGFEVATLTARPSVAGSGTAGPGTAGSGAAGPGAAGSEVTLPDATLPDATLPEPPAPHAARPESSAPRAALPEPPLLGPAGEGVQPVYSRYWLHNRGPAPAGYLPVTVSASPGLLRTAGEPVEVDVVLASQLRDAEHEGIVTLTVPDGWAVEPGSRVYRLPAGGWQRFTATVTPPPGTPEGLYFAGARLVYGGTAVEDVVTVAVGELDGALPVPGPVPPNDAVFAGTTATTGRDTGLAVDVVEPEVVLRPGQRGAVGVTLASTARDEIRGEVQLVSPWGTWEHVSGVVRGFTLPAGGQSTVDFPVAVPADAAPGHAWAVAKVMWFGRCQYTPAVRLVVADG